MANYKMDVYVVFKSPKSHPGKFVCQLIEVKGHDGRPGKVVAVGDTIEEVREKIPKDCIVITLNDVHSASDDRVIEIHECPDGTSNGSGTRSGTA